ncbi:MAG: CDP-2,3-bis-(O-geranylgeranyl)-sn-glycerol synthase [archaeon]|nr:CDP-2,3-bis-(O-geranylgeranyl)-sn-glycerol synthase [archaeon]
MVDYSSIAEFVLRISLALLPIYVSNACAMLLGGKTPIDFGKRFFDGRPWLGAGKTFKGAVFGIAAGILVAAAINGLLAKQTMLYFSNHYVLISSILVVLAILGDMIGSFIKRRLNIERGKPVFLLDQLDFVIVPMLFLWSQNFISLTEIIMVLLITLIVHRAANFIAFKFKLKKVPW